MDVTPEKLAELEARRAVYAAQIELLASIARITDEDVAIALNPAFDLLIFKHTTCGLYADRLEHGLERTAHCR